MKPKKTPAADRLTVEARLDAIEALHLANPLAPLSGEFQISIAKII